MPIDSDTRQAAVNYAMRRWGYSITKAELRAVIDAMDDWFDANVASLNGAIPLPQRTVLTAADKALLLSLIAQRRAGLV